MRANLTRLSQRFPPGLKYLVNYDTTTFVFDTIHDVLITLADRLRAGRDRRVSVPRQSCARPLIPAIAVPVSVIGTFAVLLAMGYSANTISLLAMVLAIGIVVDDAIVVVENVERVMEEEPDLSPADATKKAMAADHRRRSSRSRWCCFRCSCRSPSSPAFPARCSGSSR